MPRLYMCYQQRWIIQTYACCVFLQPISAGVLLFPAPCAEKLLPPKGGGSEDSNNSNFEIRRFSCFSVFGAIQ